MNKMPTFSTWSRHRQIRRLKNKSGWCYAGFCLCGVFAIYAGIKATVAIDWFHTAVDSWFAIVFLSHSNTYDEMIQMIEREERNSPDA